MRERERQTHTHAHTQTDGERDTQTQRERERERGLEEEGEKRFEQKESNCRGNIHDDYKYHLTQLVHQNPVMHMLLDCQTQWDS